MRLSFVLLTTLLIVLGCAVYNVANRVQLAEKKQHRLEMRIADEQENLRVLHAEWTYLTNPERLEKIATQNFGLVAMDGSQYVLASAVPMRATLEAQEPEALEEKTILTPPEPVQLAKADIKADVTATAPEKTELAKVEPAPTTVPAVKPQPDITSILANVPSALPPPAAMPLPPIEAIPASMKQVAR